MLVCVSFSVINQLHSDDLTTAWASIASVWQQTNDCKQLQIVPGFFEHKNWSASYSVNLLVSIITLLATFFLGQSLITPVINVTPRKITYSLVMYTMLIAIPFRLPYLFCIVWNNEGWLARNEASVTPDKTKMWWSLKFLLSIMWGSALDVLCLQCCECTSLHTDRSCDYIL